MTEAQTASLSLLPWPQELRCRSGAASSEDRGVTAVQWSSAADRRVQAYIDRILAGSRCGPIDIAVALPNTEVIPQAGMQESFELRLTALRIDIRARSTWGALHALTTLRQLVTADTLPEDVHIVDHPRFAWRGLMLDVTRHFIPLPQLFAVVDGLQLLKMNVLHLHLSDDQGFRFGSEVWPRLASDDHYTKQQLRQLVAYAADRGVRVIPELDVPGHVNHWLLAYPEWGCEKALPSQRFGVHPGCLDPTKELVFDALAKLFAEVAEVFPDRFVHVGGDEVKPKWWQRSERVQAFIAEHKLQDARGLQNYFLLRLQQILAGLDRQIIGWDEVLHEHMPDCVVQNWRGATTRDRALAVPRPCIVSAPYYLDLHFPADIHYRFDPEAEQNIWLQMEDDLATDLRLAHVAPALSWTHQWRQGAINLDDVANAQVLGGEACLWAELVDAVTLPMRLWSRLPAIAERLWSAADCTDVQDFYRRLNVMLDYPELSCSQHQHHCLQQLGLTPAQINAVQWLEPTKWYSRLLGEQAMQARLQGSEMPQARPYTVATPLNRVVDFLLPESLVAQSLSAATGFESLIEVCGQALSQPWSIDDSGVREAIEANLAALKLTQAAIRGDRATAEAAALIEESYRPHGEYMPALLPHLLNHLHRYE